MMRHICEYTRFNIIRQVNEYQEQDPNNSIAHVHVDVHVGS